MSQQRIIAVLLAVLTVMSGCAAITNVPATDAGGETATETTATQTEISMATDTTTEREQSTTTTESSNTPTETETTESTSSTVQQAADDEETTDTTTETPEPSTEQSETTESTPTETTTETETETPTETTTETATETATPTPEVVDPYCGLNGSDVSILSVENDNGTVTVHGTVEQEPDQYDALKVQFYVMVDTVEGPQASELVTVTVPRGTVDDWTVQFEPDGAEESTIDAAYVSGENEEEWSCQT